MLDAQMEILVLTGSRAESFSIHVFLPALFG